MGMSLTKLLHNWSVTRAGINLNCDLEKLRVDPQTPAMRGALVFALACLWGLAGCADSPGRISVDFEWEGGAPSESLWLFARIEERAGDLDKVGNPLSFADEQEWQPGQRLQLSFDAVPNGSNLVVVVEARRGPDDRNDRANPVLYFGLSQRFELKPGVDENPGLYIRMRRTPEFSGTGEPFVVTNATGSVVSTSTITIRLTSKDVAQITVAQNRAFSLAPRTYGPEEITQQDLEDGLTRYEVTYDLNELEFCAGDALRCADGSRDLYVSIQNLQEYGTDRFIQIVLDTTGPRITDVRLAPDIAPINSTVLLSFVSNEELRFTDPAVVLAWAEPGDPGFRAEGAVGRQYRYSYVVPDASPNQDFTLEGLTVSDLYGNTSTVGAGTAGLPVTFEVDGTNPELADITVSPSRLIGLTVGATVAFATTVSECVGTISASLAGRAFPSEACVQTCTDDPVTIECTYEVDGTELGEFNEGEGPRDSLEMVIEVVDGAGNRDSKATSVTFDFGPPRPERAVFTPTGVVPAGSPVSVDIVMSEELDPAFVPELTWAPSNPGLSYQGINGRSYVFSGVIDRMTAPDGTYRITGISGQDAAGNIRPVDRQIAPELSALVVDTSAPMVTLTSVEPAVVGGRQTTTIRAQVSDGLTPTVTVDGIQLSTCQSVGGAGQWSCTWTAPSTGSSRAVPIVVSAQDAAGNLTPVQGTVFLDFTAPEILSANLSTNSARANTDVIFEVVINEPHATTSTPEVTVSPNTLVAAGAPVPNAERTAFTFRYAITDTTPQETFTFSDIVVEDRFGNRTTRTLAPPPTVTVDSRAPEITGLTITGPRAVPLKHFALGDVVTLDFSVDEVPGSPPDVRIAGQAANCTTNPPPTVTVRCTFTVSSGLIPADSEEYVPVVVRVVDAAGNAGLANDSVLIDFKAPAVIGNGVRFAPSIAGRGDAVTLTLTIDEPLAAGSTGAPNPELRWTGADPGFAPISSSGLAINYSLVVPASGVNGTFGLQQVVLRDLVGNQRTQTLTPVPELTIDTTPPTISNLDRTPERAREGTTVTVTFNVGDANDTAVVTVGQANMTCTTAGTQYTCTYGVPTNQPATETVENILIEARDPAGNIGRTTTNVVFDFVEPGIVARSASLTKIPNPGNPLGAAIEELGAQSVAQLQFSVTEPLASAPVVTAQANGVEVSIAQDMNLSSPPRYVFAYTVPTTGAQQGLHAIEVELTDVAGNEDTVTVPELNFDVDTVAPSAPDVGTAGRILFARAPWGLADGVASPQFSLTGLAGAAEPGSLVRVVHPFSGEVIRIGADTSGAFAEPSLPMTDTASIAVEAIDGAGNTSPLVVVRDVQWIASLGGKNPGRTLPNPHRAARANEVRAARQQIDQELSAAEYRTISTTSGNVTTAASQRWQDVTIGPGIERRALAGITYDPQRGTVLVFGGFSNVDRNDTYEWDGVRWNDVSGTLGRPGQRRGAPLAYDRARGRVVMFGGLRGINSLNDTWEWDGQKWTQWSGTSTPPSARRFHAMAYDERRQVVVLYGGIDQTDTVLGDTWEFDGTQWVQRSVPCLPAPCPSTANYSVGMEYDPVRQQIVRFGGVEGFGGERNTWTYDGTAWRWVNAPGPSARVAPQLAFDRRRGVMVLFGGGDLFTNLDDTWVWDGTSWAPDTVVGRPPPLWDHMMAYSEVDDEIVAIGGQFNDFSYSDETYIHTGSRWIAATQRSGPSRRNGPVFARIGAGPDILLFGGETNPLTPTKLSDAWLFNGRIWSALPASGITQRSGAGDAVDVAGGRALFFGGMEDLTVVFNDDGEITDFVPVLRNDLVGYDGTTWSTLSNSVGPAGRFEPGMAVDPARRTVVIFGGATDVAGDPRLPETFLRDTWVYNLVSSSWTQVATTGTRPSARHGVAMAYDPTTNRILLFGGRDSTGTQADTWSFDPATQQWTQLTPATSPSGRFWSNLVYDEDRQRLLLFGGTPGDINSGVTLDDTWEWTGTTWVQVQPPTAPLPREYYGLAYGGSPSAVFAFGGRGSLDEVWRKQIPTGIRAGTSLNFDWADAQVATDAIEQVAISMRTGATGGARIDYWVPVDGNWNPLAANTVGATAPSLLRGSLTGPSARAAVAGDGQFSFLVSSNDSLGPSATTPSVALGTVELRVDYRLP